MISAQFLQHNILITLYIQQKVSFDQYIIVIIINSNYSVIIYIDIFCLKYTTIQVKHHYYYNDYFSLNKENLRLNK